MLAGLSLDDLFKKIMGHAKKLLGVDRSTLFLFDAKRLELWSRVADGVPPIRIPHDAGIAGAVCVSKTLLNIPNAYEDARFNPEVDRQTGYTTKSILAFPILNGANDLLGVLQLINKLDGRGVEVPFNDHDEELLQAFSSQARSHPHPHTRRRTPRLTPHPKPHPASFAFRWRWRSRTVSSSSG